MNDLPVGRSVEETMRLVQAFQYADVELFYLKSIFEFIFNY